MPSSLIRCEFNSFVNISRGPKDIIGIPHFGDPGSCNRGFTGNRYKLTFAPAYKQQVMTQQASVTTATVAREGEWFEEWFDSAYYHKLYANRDDCEAAVFINKLVKYLRPVPGSSMLDIGCGKGRHARMLAAYNYDVTGLDLSASSIKRAKRYENDNLHFYEHDMREPFMSEYFDYAFNLFTSFGYFNSKEENHLAVEAMASALKSNGYLVVDYMNVNYVSQHLVENESKLIDGVRFDIRRSEDERHFYKNISISSPHHKTLRFTERVERLELSDFYRLFSAHDLEMEAKFGDYQLNGFNRRTSPRLIMLFRKRY